MLSIFIHSMTHALYEYISNTVIYGIMIYLYNLYMSYIHYNMYTVHTLYIYIYELII